MAFYPIWRVLVCYVPYEIAVCCEPQLTNDQLGAPNMCSEEHFQARLNLFRNVNKNSLDYKKFESLFVSS